MPEQRDTLSVLLSRSHHFLEEEVQGKSVGTHHLDVTPQSWAARMYNIIGVYNNTRPLLISTLALRRLQPLILAGGSSQRPAGPARICDEQILKAMIIRIDCQAILLTTWGQ